MREYETTYVLNPAASDAMVKASLDKIGAVIGRHKGSIIRSQNLGKKTLAYRIKKQTKGVYLYLDYCADNEAVSEIEHLLRLDEQVIRYLTVKLNDDVDVEGRKAELEKEAAELAQAMAKVEQQVAKKEAAEGLAEEVM